MSGLLALDAGLSIFELARYMGTSVEMIDRVYGHLAHGAEDTARARLDAAYTERLAQERPAADGGVTRRGRDAARILKRAMGSNCHDPQLGKLLRGDGAAALSRAAPATGRSRPPRRRCPDAARMLGSAGGGSRVFPSVLATNLRHAQSSQDSNSGPSVPSDYKQRDAARCVWPAKRPIWTAARCTQMQPAEPSPYAHGTRAQLVSVGVTRSWAKRNSSSLSRPRP